VLVLRRGESWDGCLVVVWEGRGERWDGEEEGETEEESVGRVSIYWLLPMESPTETFRRYIRR
jgi:hypothetical protein